MTIPFFNYHRQYQKIKTEIDDVIKKVLNSGQLILGEEVQRFENNFAKYVGAGFGVGVNSGTDALKIAACALGLKAGDEIITVANTAVPTVSAIRELGLIPKFVDVKKNFAIDENLIEQKITAKTRSILPVHLYGQSCEMNKILKIARKYGLKLIEDCAQAHGAKHQGKKVGTFGDIACFSFYPTKNLGAYGDGGIIVTSNKNLAEKCRLLRTYGMENTYHSKLEGYNSRLDELQAAILNIKLKYLDKQNAKRQKIAGLYLKKIRNERIILPNVSDINEHVFHLFVIRTKNRPKLLKYLSTNNIGYGIHYPYPIHQQTAYKFLKSAKLPNTERYAKEIVSLPIFPELQKKEIDYIIKILNLF